jgi:hypothetical protein
VRLSCAMLALLPSFLLPAFTASYEADEYASAPVSESYAERRDQYLATHAETTGGGAFSALARMELDHRPDPAAFDGDLEQMDQRRDCADFRLHPILRLLYAYSDLGLVSDDLLARARASVLGFKYWPDEPGKDHMCTWSENHHILFSAGGYLAGQLYPTETFANSGETGAEKMARFRPRVIRWLDLRYMTGFSEWLSNVYHDEDISGLVSLIDFAEDEEIVAKASMVLDLMLLDVAVNQFRGTFGSTHGRSYLGSKRDGGSEATRSLTRLVFGMNSFATGNQAGVSLALSKRYRAPAVLEAIAQDVDRAEMEHRGRSGIRLEEAERWGLDYDRLEDGMTFLSLEAYSHPLTIELMTRMLDEYDWWDNRFFEGFKSQRKVLMFARRLGLLPTVARVFERDVTRNMRTEVNIYTYRTPDYMLSAAQDYRKGYGGDQQHIWQATLGKDAVCFTTHPARIHDDTPNYWTGSGSLPRVGQVKNVALILYDISTRPGLYITHRMKFTHAWLPRDKFDEVISRGKWTFARKGDAYLALWSRNDTRWADEGEWKDIEIIADGKRNIWICELGRRTTDGEFEEFVARIQAATPKTRGLHVTYDSPSQGKLEFGWDGALTQDGAPVQLGDYPRYDSPYAQVAFPAEGVDIEVGAETLWHDFSTLTREASALLMP